jgi:hypothetical protein
MQSLLQADKEFNNPAKTRFTPPPLPVKATFTVITFT